MTEIAASTILTYEPLPDNEAYFRVLELQHGEGSIVCNLSVRRFDEFECTYEAVSCVWGDPTDNIGILCDGKSVQVTPNLHALLQQFRYEDRTRILWADAICINQNDDEEKSFQVQKMGDIYANARTVLTWLGEDDGTARECFDAMQTTNRIVESIVNPALLAGGFSTRFMEQLAPIYHQIPETRLEQIRKLLTERPYFTRLWIVQEIGLARSAILHCGKEKMQVSELMLYVLFTSGMLRLSCPRFASSLCTDYACYWRGYKRGTHWTEEKIYLSIGRDGDFISEVGSGCLSILHRGRIHNAKDPRDRIYSFYGHPLLASLAKNVPVNYEIPKEELYYRVALSLLNDKAYGWKVLSYCSNDVTEIYREGGNSYPSWVPVWDIRGKMSNPDQKEWYAAGGRGKKLEMSVQPNRHLLLRGLIVDTVRSVTRDIRGPVTIIDIMQDLEIGTTDITEEQFRDLSLAVVRGEAEDGGPADANNFSLLRHKERWFAYLDLIASRSEDTTGQYFAASMKHAVLGNLVFQTEDGYFGVGLPLIQPGDLCCLFVGADMPFILRPTKQPDQYDLVGCCYLQGYMVGEEMDALYEAGMGLQDLEIV